MDNSGLEMMKIFVSYSHVDSDWLKRLQVHLRPLERDLDIEIWSDTAIQPGEDWRQEIEQAMEASRVAVLLVTADFLASEFVDTEELPRLLEAAEKRGTLILPVILKSCLFSRTPRLSRFKAINDPMTPLVNLSVGAQETVFLAVAERIQDALKPPELKSETQNQSAAELKEQLDRPARHELFNGRTHWRRLLKIGDWSLGRRNIIQGSGVFNYLLSVHDYGNRPFTILAKLRFDHYEEYAERDSATVNAGIVFSWTNTPRGHRYYNLLITGARLLLEEVGFRDGDIYRDSRHINAGVEFPLKADVEYSFAVRVNARAVDVFVDNRKIYSVGDVPLMVGKAGIRPWRCLMRCQHFEVHDA